MADIARARQLGKRFIGGFLAGQRKSFTEHFCYEEDDDGSEKAAASEDIYQGITSGGKHW
jgi:hypothetical protein